MEDAFIWVELGELECDLFIHSLLTKLYFLSLGLQRFSFSFSVESDLLKRERETDSVLSGSVAQHLFNTAFVSSSVDIYER